MNHFIGVIGDAIRLCCDACCDACCDTCRAAWCARRCHRTLVLQTLVLSGVVLWNS